MKQPSPFSTLRHSTKIAITFTLLLSLLLPSLAVAQSDPNADGQRVFLPLVVGGQTVDQVVQASATPTDLFISEYIEGSSFNKVIEIYNGTGAAVDMAATGYTLELYSNGSATASQSMSLSATLADGDVYVVAHTSADPLILAVADITNGAVINFNGDDAVVLRKNGVVVDAFGQIGFDPGTQWTGGGTDDTLRRQATVCAGDTNADDAFDASLEWDVLANNTFDGLGAHTATCSTGDTAPAVTSTSPANAATDFPIGGNLSVTFSEPVDAASGAFALSCSSSGTVALTVSGGPTTFTLDPANDLVNGESCTLTVAAASISDQDNIDPPDTMATDVIVTFSPQDSCAATFTPIPDIQGSGLTAAITGAVTTKGIVVGDYEGASPTLRGFYLQDATGDNDAATSDGIFVFNGNNDSVNLGDVVLVTGSVSEFQGQTQISASSVVACGTGSLTPTDVTLPFASADYAERYEGMLVRLPQTLYVSEHFQLGRFGQVVMSSGSRLYQPTNLFAPGPDANTLQAANNLNRIIIDDALQNQNPDPILFGRNGNPLSASNTLRGGDTATGIVGLMTYTWAGNSASGNAFRVRPINALGGSVSFAGENLRPEAAPAETGRLRVAGMNLLNFFNTFDGLPDTVDNCTSGVSGGATDCRGADTQAEFDRQWPKTVSAIIGTSADVIGVIEIENDGYGADSAIQFLVNKLNGATASGTYAFIDVDAATGQVDALGDDAIKVGLVYKPASVTPVGQTGALNMVDFVNGGDGAPRNRPALAQAFEELGTGERFVVSVNHLKSKGSACDASDAGDGQGNCNIVRTNAANLLTAWLASDPTGTGDSDALIIGDLNSYAMEDPITAIKSAGYTNLIYQFGGDEAYSYVFDGQWGYLDHALSTNSLTAQVSSVADWHINADEPSVLDYNTDFKSAGQIASLYNADQFRIADHDPVLVDLSLDQTPPIVTVNGVSDGATYTLGSVPSASCATQDVASGVAASATLAISGGNPDGTGTFTATCSGATDNAGNPADPVSVTYTVQAPGVFVDRCGGYAVYVNNGSYIAPFWSGTVKVGTSKNNTILGTNGADLILGLGGNDQITGNGGNDVICGGNGVDLLLGLNGNDLLDGGAGNDVLNGGGGDYDQLLDNEGNDVLLDGDGVLTARSGVGGDTITITLRNGWRNTSGQAHFSGLSAGYGNDAVGLVILNAASFVVDITGDEYDVPPSPQEGQSDKLVLAGVINAASNVIKFEKSLIISADTQTIPGDKDGAEYLTEPVGEESAEAESSNRIFLPVVTR